MHVHFANLPTFLKNKAYACENLFVTSLLGIQVSRKMTYTNIPARKSRDTNEINLKKVSILDFISVPH